MIEAVSLHGKVGIAEFDGRTERYSQRCNEGAPSRNVLVCMNAMIPLSGKASVFACYYDILLSLYG